MDGAMRGLADGLDPASSYLTPDEVRALDSRDAAPDRATSASRSSRQFYLRIVGVRDGSPAAKAGLRSGDFIRAIGDVATRDMSAFAGTRLLAGAAGSKVSLLVFRGNAADPHPIELIREDPPTDRATSRQACRRRELRARDQLRPGAAAAIRAAVQALGAAASRASSSTCATPPTARRKTASPPARLFVAKGTLADARRARRRSGGHAAAAGDGALTMPVVAIVSRGTANAAEVLAVGARPGTSAARSVGEPTAGLAGVQTLVRAARRARL